jgi:hypothetical protein
VVDAIFVTNGSVTPRIPAVVTNSSSGDQSRAVTGGPSVIKP